MTLIDCLQKLEDIAIVYDNTSENYDKFEDVLNEYIMDHNLYIQTLLTCKCCDRHQENKPEYLQELINPHFNNTQLNESHCRCPCRHYSRAICRAYYKKQNHDHDQKQKTQKSDQSGLCFRSQCEFRCNC